MVALIAHCAQTQAFGDLAPSAVCRRKIINAPGPLGLSASSPMVWVESQAARLPCQSQHNVGNHSLGAREEIRAEKISCDPAREHLSISCPLNLMGSFFAVVVLLLIIWYKTTTTISW